MRRMTLAMAVLMTATIVAQSPAPAFDEASIKPSKSGGGPYIRVLPGRFLATYSSLRDLIAFAYGLRDDQIADGPSWIVSDHYDVEATAVGNPPVGRIAGAMLQELLKDRFRLLLRRETKQLPVYELTVDKNGLKLQPTKEGSCTPFSPDSPPLPAAPDAPRLPFCGPRYGPKGSDWTLDGTGIRMDTLAESLSRVGLGRSVIDKTGLTGSYDVHLKWTADTLAAGTQDNLQGPSFFTSLREQLGLKLESAKGPVEVFVIDSAEKPAGN
jgi:uncharacterized protein (TIGR03435 family)